MPRYVLLQPLPVSVAFRSCWFRLVLEHSEMPCGWTFYMQVDGSPYRCWWIGHWNTEENARVALYVEGVEVPRGTVPETVMLRLVRAGSALQA